jgi:hypothetical protein
MCYSWKAPAPTEDDAIYKRMVECYLRVAHLGQQQRSDYWTIYGGARALAISTFNPLEAGPDALASAVDLYERIDEAAVRRCKLLLPEEWAGGLERTSALRHLLPRAHEQLQLLRQGSESDSTSGSGRSRGRGTRAALLSTAETQSRAVEEAAPALRLGHPSQCDGCGQRAVGLRRCSRCKQAQYCRCVVLPGMCIPLLSFPSCLLALRVNVRGLCTDCRAG